MDLVVFFHPFWMWDTVAGFAIGVCKGCTSRILFFSNSVKSFGLPPKKKKVPCDPSLHAQSLISDDVRSNWAASVLSLCLSCGFNITAWREKKNKDGNDWGKSEAFCHSKSPIPKQQRLTATTNTLEINYLWNRVRASLIFSFYPIKLSNHPKPL